MKKAKYKLIYNRKNKLNSEGKALIQLRITLGSTQKYFSTGVYITPNCWNSSECSVKRMPNKIEINQHLNNLIDKIERFEYREISNGRQMDLNRISEIIDDIPEGDFIRFFEREAENSNRKKNTIRNYNTCLGYLKKHGVIKSFSDISYKNIVSFNEYLKNRNLTNSTVHKQHKVLKLFIRKAMDADILRYEQNPYLKFRPDPPERGNIKYLTIEELEQLKKKELHVDRLNKVRDLFLFSCYTGLSYADMERFTKDHIIFEDGIMWIDIDRLKTTTMSYVPIFPEAQELLEKYDYKLPVITNQKLNAYLKEIQVLCELKKTLTFHMARHTFATTITLSNGVPIETVSRMLGHSDIKITQVYAKILKQKIKEDTKRLM